MTNSNSGVNGGTIKPLKNVTHFTELVERVMHRHDDLPGIATFHGFSGYGKTFSATYAAHRYRAFYVEMGESWSKGRLLDALGHTVGLPMTGGTIATKVEKIVRQIVDCRRPIIIDEADYLFTRGMHEMVREIHDNSRVPIILIGEELLPQKIMEKSERFHNRVLDWCAAQPIDVKDAQLLTDLYCKDVEIEKALFDLLFEAAGGRARRLCVNLNRVAELAQVQGLQTVHVSDWGDREIYTGQPPMVRAA